MHSGFFLFCHPIHNKRWVQGTIVQGGCFARARRKKKTSRFLSACQRTPLQNLPVYPPFSLSWFLSSPFSVCRSFRMDDSTPFLPLFLLTSLFVCVCVLVSVSSSPQIPLHALVLLFPLSLVPLSPSPLCSPDTLTTHDTYTWLTHIRLFLSSFCLFPSLFSLYTLSICVYTTIWYLLAV